MNEKALIEIGKLLFVLGVFVVPVIFKYLKKQKEEQARNTEPYSNPASNLHPKIKVTKENELYYDEIMSELFGVPEVKPVRVQPQNKKPKQPYSGPDFKNRDAEKLMPELPTEKRSFQEIDLKKNVVATVNQEFSKGTILTQTMTNHDWKKAIIMKEILESPIALRNI